MKQKIYFTADHHFGHRRIIELCKRPFADVVEMRETLILRWNETVPPDGVVWHLGDFAWKDNADETQDVFDRLNGEKHLVAGNHDPLVHDGLGWKSVNQMAEVTVDSQRLFLCHYPMLEWPGFFHQRSPVWHLFGHVHGNREGVGASLDVGVDVWDYRPVSLDDVRKRLRTMGRIA